MAGTEENLAAAFHKYLGLYRDIESSSLSTNSPELQHQIKDTITGLIRATVLVSETGVFSSNETLDDLPTSSIKFLLLPALLGFLTLKRTDLERPEALRLAAVYLRDFLHRCWEYGVTETRPPQCIGEEEEEEGKRKEQQVIRKNKQPTPQELQAMAQHRQGKIQRYREKKQLEARLEVLKDAETNEKADEETAREYHLTLARKFVCESVEELESVVTERQMLNKMASLNLKASNTPSTTTTTTTPPQPASTPLKPILITRDAYRKNVFGLGYPSHPSLTVEEFYDQRVRDGWFPDPSKSQSCLQERAKFSPEEEAALKEEEEEEEERKKEEDDPDSLERARERDEWRDTHRRGWGNTYNRS